jgi:hypothetical protein
MTNYKDFEPLHLIYWNFPIFIPKEHYQTNEVVGKGRKHGEWDSKGY